MKIQLGMLVEDIITRFSGIVTEICYHIEGHTEICITPQISEPGIIRPSVRFLSNRIHILDDTPINLKEFIEDIHECKAVHTIHLLLEAQGDIIPGWNKEYLDATWVRKIAQQSLKEIASMEHPCIGNL